MAETVVTREPARAPVNEWYAQWFMFRDEEEFLFSEWIAPATLEDFRDKDVLECGCGGGHHPRTIARVARSITAVDLYTIGDCQCPKQQELERHLRHERHRHHEPRLPVRRRRLRRRHSSHSRSRRRVREPVSSLQARRHDDLWRYSEEGNRLLRLIVEPLRRAVLRFLPRRIVTAVAILVTILLYPLVHSIYRLPWCSVLPYYDYFGNFRRLSFRRNVLNVFDKLNAPQTRLTSLATCREWLNPGRFDAASISIRAYKGVSYGLVGRKRND